MIPVILAGCGRIAQKHLRALRDLPLYDLVAVIDPNQDRARETVSTVLGKDSEKVRYFATTESLDEARLNGTWQAPTPCGESPVVLAIASSSGQHASLGLWGLDHGYALLLEKPMALGQADCRQLLARSLAQNLPIQMGHIYRFLPTLNALRTRLAQGELGSLLYAQTQVYWGHDPDYYQGIRGTWSQDGGALLNQTVHAVDLLRFLTGTEPSAWSGWMNRAKHRQIEAEDLGVAQAKVKDHPAYWQLVGTTASSARSPEASFDLVYTGGHIHAGLYKGKPHFRVEGMPCSWIWILRTLWKQIDTVWHRSSGGSFSVGLSCLLHAHHAAYEDLADALLNKREPLAGAESGWRAVQDILAIYASAKVGGEPVDLVEFQSTDFSTLDLQGWEPETKERTAEE